MTELLPTASDIFAGEDHLLCPVCGFEYVHPVAVDVGPINGPDGRLMSARIDNGGLRVFPKDGYGARGVDITLTFVCENWHAWDASFRFHKGHTAVAVERKPDQTSNDWSTIWRD